MMMLAGCARYAEAPHGVHLPLLPAELARPCRDPGVAAGDDARKALAATRVALGACRRQAAATAGFYEDVRKRFNHGS
jgi:hypothetical protein